MKDIFHIKFPLKQNYARRINKLYFSANNVENTNFPEALFDIVTSFETIEHVNWIKFLKEMYKILKNDGLLILSTPQNRFGKIPITPSHLIEFSLTELLNLCKEFFSIEKVIGFKAGKIYFDNDPIGTNTFLIARGKK